GESPAVQHALLLRQQRVNRDQVSFVIERRIGSIEPYWLRRRTASATAKEAIFQKWNGRAVVQVANDINVIPDAQYFGLPRLDLQTDSLIPQPQTQTRLLVGDNAAHVNAVLV